jgi:uncharacterized membrane protein YgcG
MTNFSKVTILAIFSVFILASCNRYIAAQKEVKEYYYDCPMHKDYIRYKPGVCPTCGMTLEKWEIGKMEKRNISNSQNSDSHSGHSGSGSYGGSSGGHQH